MKKIYYLIGGICLSAIVMSCDTDDSLKQDAGNRQEIKLIQEMQIKQALNQSNNHDLKSDRGDKDKDKDKSKG
ncbi:hypothetical protein [Myroides indicus]|uniref:Lipoprotein n=1 Tax=Myroides indicus TaxID=1323422 RepID=A0A4R7ETS2_9FLAO|nr:hypothetical protein [Myroides indicus]TDS56939.1 hypothetical protein C8P70_11729 [Myroides indicus]